MEKRSRCEDCGFRARYEDKPESLLGRLWRWHAGWCPGFRKYITSMPDEQRVELAQRYGMQKYAA
jgi:hypothetical protein